MQTFLIIVLSIFIIGLLIALHELGHLGFAKLFNVYCFEYSIGMGPKLFKKKGKETEFSIRALPLGGFVSMYGETEDLPEEYAELNIPEERSLLKVAKWKRAIIMSGGILMNFIVAFLLFIVGNSLPYTEISSTTQVAEGSIAAELGVVEGDALIAPLEYYDENNPTDYSIFDIVEIEGVQYNALIYINDYNDISIENYLELIPVEDLKLTSLDQFYRPIMPINFDLELTFAKGFDEENNVYIDPYTITFPVETVLNEESETYEYQGLEFDLTKLTHQRNFGQVMKASGQDWVNSATSVGRALVTLFSPETFQNLGGVVAIFQQSTDMFFNYGWGQYIYIWGLISVNLALFNLLPFPGLDGWHLLVVIIEGITRKEISKKFKNIATIVGMVLLIGLVLFITIRDIVGLF